VLESGGERLRAGEHIIGGAMPPLAFPQAGDRLELELGELGRLGLSFE
jgi:2-keto-4-pentenoate hydratase